MSTELQLPQCWVDYKDALEAGITQLITYGPPGVGKTYGGITYGDVSRGAHRLICSEDMTSADVTGHWMPSASGTWQWHDGAVLRAWQGDGVNGARVVADEIDRASGDVLSVLLSMFDSVESASFLHPESGLTIRPLEGFSVVMTTNIEDMRDLPTALKDRFPVAIRINAPHPEALKFLSEDLRVPASLSADADEDRRISLRGWKAFDKMRDHMRYQYGQIDGEERAARMIFGDQWVSVIDSIRINNISNA
jgi:MoxR-like ATPase